MIAADSAALKNSNSNELIRGSAEFKEDPEVILYMNRPDKRSHRIAFEVGKSRWGAKPEPMALWFDAGTLRLTPFKPVVALLLEGEKTRQQLITEATRRFKLSERKLDRLLKETKPYLVESYRGHEKVFRLATERLTEADWLALREQSDSHSY